VADLDVDSVALARGDEAVAVGAKVADPVTVGAIVVALSASGGVFTSLIGVLKDWLDRHRADHKIIVTIEGDTLELDRATVEQQRELIAAYLGRHVSRDG
jgi:Effector Associated Constant Component 1